MLSFEMSVLESHDRLRKAPKKGTAHHVVLYCCRLHEALQRVYGLLNSLPVPRNPYPAVLRIMRWHQMAAAGRQVGSGQNRTSIGSFWPMPTVLSSGLSGLHSRL